VAVLRACLELRQADARDLRIRVDRTWDGAIVDDGVVAARVLRRHLALAEGRVRELPIACAVADGVDVRNGRAPMLVRGDPLALVELDADGLEPDPFDVRAPSDRDEHEIGLHRLAVAEVDGQLRAAVLDSLALLLQM